MSLLKIDAHNKMFSLAVELVNYSNRNIFLTGKAGTGKTTFLKYIRDNCHKQLAIVAPTGVAAINAGGVTIHSFFQLPISPFIPSIAGFNKNEETINKHSLLSRLRMNSEKKKVLQELELLVIDEISMVRCDTLDAVDTILRHIRNKHSQPFGGVQVLFIGDMFQLPPVIKDAEWQMLADYYKGPYFFDSLVMQEQPPVYIEFDKIYRQSEQRFIQLLNQVRNNEMDGDGLEILESRFQSSFRRSKNDGYIILTTHNETARQINIEKLTELSGDVFSYKAEIEEDFPTNSFPADELLQLKVGAQVMFIKNDLDKSKRFFNGKIGTITRLDDEKILVQCENETDTIEVKKEKWENIRYDLNKTTRQLEETLLGSFSQYPLRLAWAITIHKSQGLTFEKAIIDAGKSFAAGQVYVALSRCTSLDGLVLNSSIAVHNLKTDYRIVNFSQQAGSVDLLQEELAVARKNYWQSILFSLFDFSPIIFNSNELILYVKEHTSSFNQPLEEWLNKQHEQLTVLQKVAERFQQQLQQLFNTGDELLLQQRIKAAQQHFQKETATLVDSFLQSTAVTDSRLHAKEYNELIKEIITQLHLKQFIFSATDALTLNVYLQRKKQFTAPSISINAYASADNRQYADIPNAKLHTLLRKKRDDICERKQQPIYMVASSATLIELCTYLPQTTDELKKINGFGPVKVEQYGQAFLDIIVKYCEENNLSSQMLEKTTKRERKAKSTTKKKKIDTYAASFDLYKEGKTIAEIAAARNLSITTIEGHLAKYISLGELALDTFVSADKIKLISDVLNQHDGKALTPIKEQLGDAVTFGEIRMVIASLNKEAY